ncbi:DNA-binding response regulator [Leucobacter sp. OLJS4]|uniref:response regulator transcription factor n=1 Tax=unclassified Leucobacter TaxID=2621730 RepID=UPI000C17D8AD|nr:MULTISPECIES: response regulator transcription factor [unclassified Leucobacter]PII88058.1 DNA-binding response regulator [Leucobacter sp. OLTLW20]PIJ12886.1 DNA-binding response regulator [Leucobacter sp. OLJS4]
MSEPSQHEPQRGAGPEEVRVELVEDDPTVRGAVEQYLGAHGYRVRAHANGIAARTSILSAPAGERADVLVIDRMLPGLSGDELVRQVRARSQVPILMLTALAETEDRVEGLELGADDYLAKPFSLRELTLRIGSLARRSRTAAAAVDRFAVGDFEIDSGQRRAWVRGTEVLLTSREYDLLRFLVRHPDRTLGRDLLISEVWGWSFGDPSTVTVHVRRLREKIEHDPADPRYLRTEWGAGYRFSATGREPEAAV